MTDSKFPKTPKTPKIDIAELDQHQKVITAHLVPLYAAVFRQFCEEKDVTRGEALALAIGFMQAQAQRKSS